MDFILPTGGSNRKNLSRGMTGLDLCFRRNFDTGVEGRESEWRPRADSEASKIIPLKEAEDLSGASRAKMFYF